MNQVEWYSFEKKGTNTFNTENTVKKNGQLEYQEACEIIDRYIQQTKPVYEHIEDAMVETVFSLSIGENVEMIVYIIGPQNYYVEVSAPAKFFPKKKYQLSSIFELKELVRKFFDLRMKDLSGYNPRRSSLIQLIIISLIFTALIILRYFRII
jgi:hypothetical protein